MTEGTGFCVPGLIKGKQAAQEVRILSVTQQRLSVLYGHRQVISERSGSGKESISILHRKLEVCLQKAGEVSDQFDRGISLKYLCSSQFGKILLKYYPCVLVCMSIL